MLHIQRTCSRHTLVASDTTASSTNVGVADTTSVVVVVVGVDLTLPELASVASDTSVGVQVVTLTSRVSILNARLSMHQLCGNAISNVP